MHSSPRARAPLSRTRPRHRGVSLVEMMLVTSISALLVAGAAAHLRALRHVGNEVGARREALQNVRVAIDRIARHIRAAKAIADIRPPGNPEGSITITDATDANHVFRRLSDDTLCYGTDAATELLASGISELHFRGFDAQGEVPSNEPERMEAIEITLTAAVPDTADTITLTTRVRLRRQVGGAARIALSYASTYGRHEEGLRNYWRAFGPPDGRYALTGDDWGARFSGFAPPRYTGTVHRIYVGFYMRHIRGDGLDLEVKLGRRTILERKYEDVFGGVHDAAGWWWVDITDTRPKWDDEDIANLSILVNDSGNGEFALDSVAVRALFDEPEVVTLWAHRQGGFFYPHEWLNPANAFGSPDRAYATGTDDPRSDMQSFRMAVPDPDSGVEILSVHVCINGYFTRRLGRSDELDIGTALPTEWYRSGTWHRLQESYLKAFVGSNKQGDMLLDVTTDRAWTWADLSTLEIRVHVDTEDSRSHLMADAIGWRVTYITGGKGISGWSEQ